MSQVIERLREKVGQVNLANECSRDQCEVCLVDVPLDRIIIDADLAFSAHGWNGERCDFIVFVVDGDGVLHAQVVELKSGSFSISKAVRQLRKGADFVDQVGLEVPSPICLPILFHGRSISPRNRKRLNRLKVAFRGLELTIKTQQCGRERNLALALGM